jgi:hypothetical protein
VERVRGNVCMFSRMKKARAEGEKCHDKTMMSRKSDRVLK